MNVPCEGRWNEWGAGDGPADMETAKAGCAVCPLVDGRCLAMFEATANTVQRQALGGMVLGGLSGRDLERELSRIRNARRAAA